MDSRNSTDDTTNWKALAVISALSAFPVALFAIYLMLRASQLPKTIAIHWGVNGQVNGTTSLISFIIFFTLFNGA